MIHIVGVISWLAGLLYLPRLFVYHCNAKKNNELANTLKVMEKRLLRIIMNPAMIVTIISGGILSIEWYKPISGSYWLYIKIILVLCLIMAHMAMAKWRKAFENDNNLHSEKFFRIMNEVPTLLMIGVVILVVLKPF